MKTLNKSILNEILQQRLESDLQARRIAGASLMVAQNGEVLSRLYVGSKDAEGKVPLSPNTMYRLASMTKPVTGIACLIGMQNGWYSIFDKVSDHLPAFEKVMVGRLDENGNVVPDHKPKTDLRIYQLLCHTNGIIAEDPIGDLQTENMPAESWQTCRTVVDYFTHSCCLSFDPMENWNYSGLVGFDVLACILEEKSGLPYAEFVKQSIFEPLGIRDVVFVPTEDQWERMITMTDRAYGKQAVVSVDMGRNVFEKIPLTYNSGGASLAGSMEDYFIFAEMLRGKGSYKACKSWNPSSWSCTARLSYPLAHRTGIPMTAGGWESG